MEAIKQGNITEVKTLLKEGADVNSRSDDSWTGLILASASGFNEIAATLIKAGVNVNIQTTYDELKDRTALMYIAQEGRPEIVQFLLDHGADPNIKAEDGSTAESIAIRDGREELSAVLRNFTKS